MVNKIFRIHKGAKADFTGWGETEHLTDGQINTIEERNKAIHHFSSIPSPFARLAILKSAFKYIVNSTNPASSLNGDSIYHKIISDCFDVGELFFHSQKMPEIKIFEWSRNNFFEISRTNDNYKTLADALKLFLEQDISNIPQEDSESYFNFNSFEKMYIVEYKGVVVGGTSPVSLFWAAEGVEKRLLKARIQKDKFPKFCNNILFDDDIRPLHMRSEEYQCFIAEMFAQETSLRNKMPELFQYLLITRDVSPFQYKIAGILDGEIFRNLSPVNREKAIFILNDITLKKYNVRPDEIFEHSPLIIKPSKSLDDNLLPLVLPPSEKSCFMGNYYKKASGNTYDMKYGNNFDYVNEGSLFPNENNTVPYIVEESNIYKRNPPGYPTVEYPFLTINDFFEDYIIETLFPIDNDRFFCLKSNDGNHTYIPPFKMIFFKYFNAEELESKVTLDRKDGNNIIVEIEIPVSGGKIKYKKAYKKEGLSLADGKIHMFKADINEFCLTFFPFINPPGNYPCLVSITTLGTQNLNSKYLLKFFSNETTTPISIADPNTLNPRDATNTALGDTPLQSRHYKIEQAYNYIQVTIPVSENSEVNSILIPRFRTIGANNRKFVFAVDIGTTNTHIACSIDGAPEDLDFFDDNYTVNLFKSNSKISEGTALFGNNPLYKVIMFEFVPSNSAFVAQHRVNLPVRTALWGKVGVNVELPTVALFTDVGWNFLYESPYRLTGDKESITGYKWGGDNSPALMGKSIEQLCHIIRNFVILKGGSLNNVEIVSFFPTSMSDFQRGKIREHWKSATEQVIGKNTKFRWITESIAPTFYYRDKNALLNGNGINLSIDIGGGSTDVAIFNDQKLVSTTSFQFAGNVIFGDGLYNAKAINNEFTKHYQKIYVEKLIQDNVIKAILQTLFKDGKSEDVHSYLFSLDNYLKDVSYRKTLKDDQGFIIVVLYFYSAILYHICSILKSLKLDVLPQGITFSGNGSRLLSLLESEEFTKSWTKSFLGRILNKKYDQSFFDKVLKKDCVDQLELVMDSSPKKLTAWGGLLYVSQNQKDQDNNTGVVYQLNGNQQISFKEAKEPAFKNICLNEIKVFNSHFISQLKEFKTRILAKNNQELILFFEENMEKNLTTIYEAGLNSIKQKSLVINESDFVPETLFFQPLKGIIYQFLSGSQDKQSIIRPLIK